MKHSFGMVGAMSALALGLGGFGLTRAINEPITPPIQPKTPKALPDYNAKRDAIQKRARKAAKLKADFANTAAGHYFGK